MHQVPRVPAPWSRRRRGTRRCPGSPGRAARSRGGARDEGARAELHHRQSRLLTVDVPATTSFQIRRGTDGLDVLERAHAPPLLDGRLTRRTQLRLPKPCLWPSCRTISTSGGIACLHAARARRPLARTDGDRRARGRCAARCLRPAPGGVRLTAEAADLEVSAPTRLRGGLFFQGRFTVDARQPLENATLVLAPGWLGMSINTIEPALRRGEPRRRPRSLLRPARRGRAAGRLHAVPGEPDERRHRDASVSALRRRDLVTTDDRTITVFP